jgi:hypothetical protein
VPRSGEEYLAILLFPLFCVAVLNVGAALFVLLYQWLDRP